MNRWKSVPLGDFAESVDYGVTASATQQPSGPKFLRITDIQDGLVNWDTVPWCECDGRTALDARLVPGDIVFARTGATTGKSFLIRDCPTDAVFASYLIRVRIGATANPRFISHFFQTPAYWAQITMSARGVAQPGVNATTLKALEVPLPPLPEQRRIADILDRADTLRAKRRAALAQLDTLTQAIFLDFFGDPRRPGSTGTVKTNPNLMGKLTRIRTGKLDANAADEDGTYPFFTCAVEPLRINTPSFDCKAVLVAGNGDLNVKYYEGKFNAYQRTYVIESLDEEKLVPRFLYAFLDIYVSELRKQAIGGVIKYIKLPYLTEAVINLPSSAEQRAFALRIDVVERLKSAHRTSLAEFDALFASLQHRAFRGEL